MKGNISISDFIHRVKQELVDAQEARIGDPFYRLAEVTLEISFVLDTTAKAGGSLYVVEMSGETKAQQSHKVTLKLLPLERSSQDLVQFDRSEEVDGQATAGTASADSSMPPSGGGGTYSKREKRLNIGVVYDEEPPLDHRDI